jgi:hypothetical protein
MFGTSLLIKVETIVKKTTRNRSKMKRRMSKSRRKVLRRRKRKKRRRKIKIRITRKMMSRRNLKRSNRP